jgi:hypothetical protein
MQCCTADPGPGFFPRGSKTTGVPHLRSSTTRCIACGARAAQSCCKDYLTVPTEEIGSITSLLTMVGGRIVYAAGPYAALEDRLPAN